MTAEVELPAQVSVHMKGKGRNGTSEKFSFKVKVLPVETEDEEGEDEDGFHSDAQNDDYRTGGGHTGDPASYNDGASYYDSAMYESGEGDNSPAEGVNSPLEGDKASGAAIEGDEDDAGTNQGESALDTTPDINDE
eukprot:1191905-Prorocentrum_minimum.AAC.1